MSNDDGHLLIVEDEPHWQEAIQDLLSLMGHPVAVALADDAAGALQALEARKPDAVLLDWKLAHGDDGLALGQQLQAKGVPPERIILISGSEPGLIPPHPYRFVPKSRMADSLIPTLQAVLGMVPASA